MLATGEIVSALDGNSRAGKERTLPRSLCFSPAFPNPLDRFGAMGVPVLDIEQVVIFPELPRDIPLRVVLAVIGDFG